MQEIVIGVGGMSCQGCVKNVTGVLQAFDDIDRVAAELGTLQRVLAAVEHFRGAAQLLRTTLGGTE